MALLVWFGNKDGVLTKEESKRLAELETKPRGWLRRDVLAITRAEHQRLKEESPNRLTIPVEAGSLTRKAVQVIEIPEDEERERLRLSKKLQEAPLTEICFTPDFDTGKMRAFALAVFLRIF